MVAGARSYLGWWVGGYGANQQGPQPQPQPSGGGGMLSGWEWRDGRYEKLQPQQQHNDKLDEEELFVCDAL